MSSITSISFFTPISLAEGSHSFLAKVDGYFHLFQKVAIATVIPNSNKLNISLLEKQPQPVYMIALKVASYITLVMPLIMLIMKAIIRSRYEIDSQPSAPTTTSNDRSSSSPYASIHNTKTSTATSSLKFPDLLPLVNKYAAVSRLYPDPIKSFNDDIIRIHDVYHSDHSESLSNLRNGTIIWNDIPDDEKQDYVYYFAYLTLIDIIKPSEFLRLVEEIKPYFLRYEWIALAVYKKINYTNIPQDIIKQFDFNDYCLLMHQKIINLTDIPQNIRESFDASNWITLAGYEVITLKDIPQNIRNHFNAYDWLNFAQFNRVELSAIPENIQKNVCFLVYFIDKIKENVFTLDQLPDHAINTLSPDDIINLYNASIINSVDELPDSIKNRYDQFSNDEKNEIMDWISCVDNGNNINIFNNPSNAQLQKRYSNTD